MRRLAKTLADRRPFPVGAAIATTEHESRGRATSNPKSTGFVNTLIDWCRTLPPTALCMINTSRFWVIFRRAYIIDVFYGYQALVPPIIEGQFPDLDYLLIFGPRMRANPVREFAGLPVIGEDQLTCRTLRVPILNIGSQYLCHFTTLPAVFPFACCIINYLD